MTAVAAESMSAVRGVCSRLPRLYTLAFALLGPSSLAAADECPWYVSQDNPDAWIELHEGGRVVWVHVPGAGNIFDVYPLHDLLDMVPGNDIRAGLQYDDGGQVRRGVELDFQTVDSREAVIVRTTFAKGSTVYFRTCAEPVWQPVPAARS